MNESRTPPLPLKRRPFLHRPQLTLPTDALFYMSRQEKNLVRISPSSSFYFSQSSINIKTGISIPFLWNDLKKWCFLCIKRRYRSHSIFSGKVLWVTYFFEFFFRKKLNRYFLITILVRLNICLPPFNASLSSDNCSDSVM